jgi:multidrug resistance efflux pump
VAIAAFVLWRLVDYYMFAPWTRDGHVRADVVQVAPDVGGLIVSVKVIDNQPVNAGQVLFVIDQARYELALRQAQATALQRRATLDQARREDARNRTLGDLVAREVTEESRSRVQTAEAALADADVAIDTARLNLQRTTVVSPVDGYLNDRAPRTGEYVTAGRSVLSVVDLHSFRVDGYFEETKLHGIDIGQPVDIKVMGETKILRGHVQSIVAGIEDRDRTQGSNLLPNVNPAFSWVRLAQRIPVRIALDEVPADFRMIAGRTATVSVRDIAPLAKSNTAAGAGGVAAASGASAAAPVSAASGVLPVNGIGAATASAPGATPGASQ